MSRLAVDSQRMWTLDGFVWSYSIILPVRIWWEHVGWKPHRWSGRKSHPGLWIVRLAFCKLAGHITEIKPHRADIGEIVISMSPPGEIVMRLEKGNYPPGSWWAVWRSNWDFLPSGNADLHIREAPSILLVWPRPRLYKYSIARWEK